MAFDKFNFFRKKQPSEAKSADENPPVAEESLSPDVSSKPIDASAEIKQDKNNIDADVAVTTESNPAVARTQTTEQKKQADNVFARIKKGLARTGNQLGEGLGTLLMGKKEIDDELIEDIESQLLMADIGIDTTTKIIDDLAQKVARKQLTDSDALFRALRDSLAELLNKVEAPLTIDPTIRPFVILVVGVNGVGKTTTIGKLAKRLQQEGKSVLLAAGDTFRAAAVEQLKIWGERNAIPVVSQPTGSDSASVIFDAVQSAKARHIDVVIADTAGRLHNKSHLMEELSKVKRVLGKFDNTAPHEILLVLDAGTGQNALSQAEQFNAAVGITGLVLTKLDGTAKGGVVFGLSDKFGIPIRFIGVGEAIDDLQPFVARSFVDAIFARATANS